MASTAIILVGGQSKRMGRAKALLPWRGVTLLEHVAGVVGSVAQNLIIVAAPAGNGEPDVTPVVDRLSKALRSVDVQLVRDRTLHDGPLSGVRSGLERTSTRFAFVTGVDSPFLEATLVERLIGEGEPVIPIVSGKHQPLTAVYPQSSLELASQLLDRGMRRVRDLSNALNMRTIAESDLGSLDSFENLNTPGAYLDALDRESESYPAHRRPFTLEITPTFQEVSGLSMDSKSEHRPQTFHSLLSVLDAQRSESVTSPTILDEFRSLAPHYRAELQSGVGTLGAEFPIGPAEHLRLSTNEDT